MRFKFAENLHRIMCENNITQSELVRRTGISIRTIRRYLKAESEPSLWDLELIARSLNISRYSLLIL